MTNEEITNITIKMLDNAKKRILDDKPVDDITLIAYDLFHVSALREAIYLATGTNPKEVTNDKPLTELLLAFEKYREKDFDTFEENLDDICYEIEDICEKTK